MKKKNMNRFLACICMLLCMMPQLLNAQRRVPMNMPNYDNEPYHYGFIVGYNQMFYSIDYIDGFQSISHNNINESGQSIINFSNNGTIPEYSISDITTIMDHGFTVGIIGNLRLAKHFDLRLIPSLSFGDRIVLYTVNLYESPNDSNALDVVQMKSDTDHVSVELPLQLKFKSKRVNNYAAYIITGTNFKLDMYPIKDSDGNKVFINPNGITSNRFDIAAEIGAGFDFYTGFFKLGVEIKMSYGLLNVNRDVESFYNNSFESLRNKTFQLSFTFE